MCEIKYFTNNIHEYEYLYTHSRVTHVDVLETMII